LLRAIDSRGGGRGKENLEKSGGHVSRGDLKSAREKRRGKEKRSLLHAKGKNQLYKGGKRQSFERRKKKEEAEDPHLLKSATPSLE